MIGLLQRIGHGIENAGLAMEGALLNAECATKNAITSIKTDITASKHRKEYEKGLAKNTQRHFVRYDDCDVSDLDEDEIREAIADFVSEITDYSGDLSELNDSLSVESIAQMKELLKHATPEQRKEISEKVIPLLDEFGKVIFMIRAELAGAINCPTPIMQQVSQQPSSLQQQLMAGNQIDGRDLAQQFITPVGINAPIQGQA